MTRTAVAAPTQPPIGPMLDAIAKMTPQELRELAERLRRMGKA